MNQAGFGRLTLSSVLNVRPRRDTAVSEAFEFLAVMCGSLFAGAALCINVVEHPARMLLETRVAALQWAPESPACHVDASSLSLVSFIPGVAVWFTGGSVGWLVAAMLVGTVVPF
jgi:hypothetical protein